MFALFGALLLSAGFAPWASAQTVLPHGVAVDSASGTVFQVDPTRDQLRVYQATRHGWLDAGTVPTGSRPVAVVVDPRTHLVHVANQSGHSITTIAPTVERRVVTTTNSRDTVASKSTAGWKASGGG